jgi:TonB family protein
MEATSSAIHLSESSTKPQQFLAHIEAEALSAQEQELVYHISQASRFSPFLDNSVAGKQRLHLVQVLGNPNTPESEWLRACEVLGDYRHNPAARTDSTRILLFAVCLSASVVIHALAMHMLRESPTYITVVNQPSQATNTPAPAPVQVDVDFGPYMADLQRRIKRVWFPPRDKVSRRVVIIFKIHENGGLSDLKLNRSSGIAAADKAALMAVENAAPFHRLPPGAADKQDIQFTFDYNAFNARPLLSGTTEEIRPNAVADHATTFSDSR